MLEEKDNLIVRLTIQFALDIIAYCEILEQQRKFVVSRQLLKAGTSVGANVHEAQNAESRADFIHKMKVAAKEANESEYWLIICQLSPSYPDCEKLLADARTILKVLSKIIGSSKK
ncbi:MAG TPA: four helix bundle protein [Saprospiraceae bacterium]|nr:four helix bundle protein [Saprospiraceae bacterium]HRK83957.1 four helix bundle protein [Saprospiraceae bacterium]